MKNVIQVNEQIQHERKILQNIYCLLQCEVEEVMYIQVDGYDVIVYFDEQNCHVSDSLVAMTIQVDYEKKILKNVTIEK